VADADKELKINHNNKTIANIFTQYNSDEIFSRIKAEKTKGEIGIGVFRGGKKNRDLSWIFTHDPKTFVQALIM